MTHPNTAPSLAHQYPMSERPLGGLALSAAYVTEAPSTLQPTPAELAAMYGMGERQPSQVK